MVFDKEEALNEILQIFKLGDNPKFSDQMKAMEKAQNYLKVIYETAFREGFEKGIEATKKVDKL